MGHHKVFKASKGVQKAVHTEPGIRAWSVRVGEDEVSSIDKLI